MAERIENLAETRSLRFSTRIFVKKVIRMYFYDHRKYRQLKKHFLTASMRKIFEKIVRKKFSDGRLKKYGEICHTFACCRMNAIKSKFQNFLKTVRFQVRALFSMKLIDKILMFLNVRKHETYIHGVLWWVLHLTVDQTFLHSIDLLTQYIFFQK